MALNPKTHTGSTKHQGLTWRRRMRIERVARMTALGVYSNQQIADHMGVDKQTIVYMKQTVAFQNAMAEIKSGVISQENLIVARSYEAQREELADMVPTALLKLRELALSANQAIALRAVGEILDRDGNHSKVSRTSVTLENQVDFAQTNQTAINILDVLRGTQSAGGAVPGGAQPGFTVTAAAARAQINLMADQITDKTLEQIDLSAEKPQ